MRVGVVGLGFVGLSNLLLLSQRCEVIGFDVDKNKLDSLLNGHSPLNEELFSDFINRYKNNITYGFNYLTEVPRLNYLIIATPTNFDSELNYFDTSSIEQIVQDAIDTNPEIFIVIKSTIPLGFVTKLQAKHRSESIVYSPEFLREGRSLVDNLEPSRIIVGGTCEKAVAFGNLLRDCTSTDNVSLMFMSSSEAECVKLFSNNYLAMRVAFFNELDSYCMENNLSTKNVISGVSLDPRIGVGYNNPSFGYGGYCLPKDTKQLSENVKAINSQLIPAIVSSNFWRFRYLTKKIVESKAKKIGIYRLVMKSGSANYRSSAILEVLELLRDHDIIINLFEPEYKHDLDFEFKYFHDISEFIEDSDLIVANRVDENLAGSVDKVFTRDVFNSDI
jgi:UDPglucose 6-dehydrogenase